MAKIRPMLGADLFCGAGGSSTGARRALRRLGIEMTLVAVNHWPVAIKTHQRNHPDARHYCVNLDAARPIELVPEGYLDLLMASPECTHHSRARGGKPMNDQSRMSAWHVVRWCTELRVKRLLVENVEEFLEWGPLNPRTNRPVKSRKGEYFLAFVRALEGIGFKVEWGVLNAADFGEATTRRRLFMMARSDGKPIVWPQPTHSKEGGSDLFGTISKWRVAREIIDWEQSGRSIFTRKKPLQPKTMARILAGARKFNWPDPFIRALRNIMDSPSEKQPTEEMGGDLLTLQACSFQEAHSFILNRHGDNGGVRASELGQPMPTATCRGAGYLVQTELKPFVLAQGSSGAPRDVDDPMPTIVGAGAISVTTPVLVNLKGRSSASSVDAPTPTLTAHARHLALAEPFLYPVNQGGDRQGCHRSAESPLPDLLTRSSLEIPRAMIAPFYGSGSGRTCKSVEAPLDTITGRGHFAVVKTTAQPFVVSPRHGGEGFGPAPRSTEQPLPTITAGGSQSALVEAALVPFLVPQFGERPG